MVTRLALNAIAEVMTTKSEANAKIGPGKVVLVVIVQLMGVLTLCGLYVEQLSDERLVGEENPHA